MAELLKTPSASEILSNPEFQKAADALEKTESQPSTDAQAGSKEAASGTTPPGLPERLAQADSAQLPETETTGPEPHPWIDQDTIDLAAAYGVSEERLKKFSSKEDFQNAASFLDEQMRASTKGPQTKVDPLGEPESQTDPPPAITPPPVEKKGGEVEQFDIEALRKEGYDEHSLKLFEAVNQERRLRAEQAKQLETAVTFVEDIKKQQELVARQQQQKVVYDYHTNVDQLSESRFGRAIDEHGRFAQITVEQKSNRDRLWAAADAVARNIQASGRPLPPMKTLLKRAEAFEFAHELVAEESQKLKDGLKAQSSMRRPAGTNRPVAGAKPPAAGAAINDRVNYIVNDPEFNRLYNQLEAESGAR
jgi:hypothetical protein